MADYVRTLRLKNIRNAAVIIIENKTHNVITYIGSDSFKDTTDGGQVNGAYAIRQPGSTLKPLLYGLCIDEGLLTPKMIITDVPVNYQVYAPENYQGIAYEKVPLHNPDCETIFKGDGPSITAPASGTEYYINKKDPEPSINRQHIE